MTFGAIKSRIADELVRPDLASQIALAVEDAIQEAAGNRFWFNEVRGLAFTLTPGVSFYSSAQIGYLTDIDALWLTVGGQRRNLDLTNALAIEQWNDGETSLTGEPYAYARQAGGLMFWMPPNLAYSGAIDGVTRFAPLADDDDTNPWMVEGERYVRALAKANVLENLVRDPAEADRQWQMAERHKRDLLAQTGGRLTTNTNRMHL